MQRTIAEVWRAVLPVERVGLHDNFFELGGTSLSLVARCASRLRAALGCEVSLVDLFRYADGRLRWRSCSTLRRRRSGGRPRSTTPGNAPAGAGWPSSSRHDAGLEGAEMEEETR